HWSSKWSPRPEGRSLALECQVEAAISRRRGGRPLARQAAEEPPIEVHPVRENVRWQRRRADDTSSTGEAPRSGTTSPFRASPLASFQSAHPPSALDSQRAGSRAAAQSHFTNLREKLAARGPGSTNLVWNEYRLLRRRR